MEYIYKIVEYVANLYDAMCAIIFLTCVLGKNNRMHNKYLFGGTVILFTVILSYFQNFSDNTIIQLANIVIICIIYEISCLNGKIGTKIIYNIVFNIVLILTNMFVVYSFVWITGLSIKQLCSVGIARIIVLVLNKIVISIILMVILLYSKEKKVEYVEWIIAFILFIGIMMVGCIIINLTKKGHLDIDEEIQLLAIAVGLLAITITTGICIYKLNKQYQYKMENVGLQAKLQEERYMLEKIEDMYEDNRILRHDLKRYLTIVQGMLSNGEVEQAKEYILKVTGNKFDNFLVIYTNSSVVNAVLNSKGEKCKNNQIAYRVIVSGQIEEEVQIDVGIMLSNLIDNAIEAEMKETQKDISVEIHHCKGMYEIIVKNYIEESILKDNPMLKTSKSNKKRHGIGIKSVKKLIKNMDGIYQQKEDGNFFMTRIIIPEYANGA